MNRTSTLRLLIALLVILNLVLLAYVFFSHSKGNRPPSGMQKQADLFIKEQLNFDESQMKVFNASKVKHQQKMKEAMDAMRIISQAYYETDDQLLKDSLLVKIETYSKNIYKINSTHFEEMKAMCNDEQLKEMNNFIKMLLSKNGNRPRKEHRPRKGPKGK